MNTFARIAALTLAAALLACPSDPADMSDAGVDSGTTLANDAGTDAGRDLDGGTGTDAGMETPDAGSGSTATGTQGFDVEGSVTVVSSSAFVPYVLVYLMAPDGTQNVCAGDEAFLPHAEQAILYIPLSEDGGVPEGGEFTLSPAPGAAFIERFRTDDAGYSVTAEMVTFESGSITLTPWDGGVLTGEYSATAPNQGMPHTLSGTFSAPLCP